MRALAKGYETTERTQFLNVFVTFFNINAPFPTVRIRPNLGETRHSVAMRLLDLALQICSVEFNKSNYLYFGPEELTQVSKEEHKNETCHLPNKAE